MAKKTKKKSGKKSYSSEEIKRARAVAAGLEASFTEPPPPGAMAPAPLLDEIREMGEAGIAGMMENLAATAPEGRAPALRAIRELGEPSAVSGLMGQARALRWSPGDLLVLRETIEALDPGAELPPELDGDAIARARKVADALAGAVSGEKAEAATEILASLPARLQEIALREALGDSGGEKAVALAGAFSARGVAPPSGLIDALASLATEEAAGALSRLAESVSGKEAGSRIRKALYRLKGKGVAVKESAPARKAAPKAAGAGIDYVRAIVSSLDGAGNFVLWIARSRQPRGRSLFQARLRHGRGIEEFVSTDVSSKELREYFGNLSEDSRLPTAEVPAGYAFWLLQRAQAENEGEGGASIPAGYTHSRLLLVPLAEPENFPFPGDHPVRRLMGASPGGGERIGGDTMLGDSAFWSWVIEEDKILSHFQKCVEALQSPVAVDDDQRRVLFDKAVEEAAGELYEDEPLRLRLGAQLEDTAYLLLKTGKEDLARECLTLADEIPGGGERPGFFTEVVRYSIGAMLDRAIRQSQEAHDHDHDHEHAHDHGEGASEAGEEAPTIITP